MRIERRKQTRPRPMHLLLRIRHVLLRTRVPEALRQTEIDDVHEALGSARAHDEVGGLDVAVGESSGVDVLEARDLQGGNGKRRGGG
jgi:hypothetical protein